MTREESNRRQRAYQKVNMSYLKDVHKPKGVVKRECLRCENPFKSLGPQHRLCSQCRFHIRETTTFSLLIKAGA